MIPIITYTDSYKTAVGQLIINIQQNEFSVPITLEDQPDLAIIPQFYQQKNGQFWLAVSDQTLVGTIALIDIDHHAGVIRKMFVSADFRGKEIGVAQDLLDTLVKHSRSVGIQNLYLGTIPRLQAAIRFYERNGFVHVAKESLPTTFPFMAVDTVFMQLAL